MRALKGNKEYTVTNEVKQRYLDEGYDIYNDDGVLIEYSPLKKIEYSKYAELKNEFEQVKEGFGGLQNAYDEALKKVSDLTKDIEKLKKELEKAKKGD